LHAATVPGRSDKGRAAESAETAEPDRNACAEATDRPTVRDGRYGLPIGPRLDSSKQEAAPWTRLGSCMPCF
jgi:hypothetical protein